MPELPERLSVESFTVRDPLPKTYYDVSAEWDKKSVFVDSRRIKFQDIVHMDVDGGNRLVHLEAKKKKYEICVKSKDWDAFVMLLETSIDKKNRSDRKKETVAVKPPLKKTFGTGTSQRAKNRAVVSALFDSSVSVESRRQVADGDESMDSDQEATHRPAKVSRQPLATGKEKTVGQNARRRQHTFDDVVQRQTKDKHERDDVTLTPPVNARTVSPVLVESSIATSDNSEDEKPRPSTMGNKKIALSKSTADFFQRSSSVATPSHKTKSPVRRTPHTTSASSRALGCDDGRWVFTSGKTRASSGNRKKEIVGDYSEETVGAGSIKKRRSIQDDDPIEEYSETPPKAPSPFRRLAFGDRNTNLVTQQRITPMRLDLPSDLRPIKAPSWSVLPAPQRRRFRGLRNLGNTCYLNASLQMLFTCFDQMSGFRKSRGDRLTQSLGWVSRQLEKEHDKRLPIEHVSPARVKDAIDAKTDKFAGSEQRDAHEFLSDLMDYVHEELEAENNESDALEHQTSKLYSPTDDFCMTLLVSLKCCSCGYSRNKEEMYRHMSIDIVADDKQSPGESSTEEITPASIEASLTAFFRPEVRELKCEKCKDGTHAEQTLRILSRPNVLVLHLKRFIVVERPILVAVNDDENTSPNRPPKPAQVEYIFQKNKAPVSIQPVLSLDAFSVQRDATTPGSNTAMFDASCQSKTYSLKSIVHHIGTRASSGHYTADAIRMDQEETPGSTDTVSKPVWVSFDDTFTSRTTLTKIAKSRFKQQSAYMLLYSFGDTTSGDEEPTKKALISPSDSEFL